MLLVASILLSSFILCLGLKCLPLKSSVRSSVITKAHGDADLLVRALRGENIERTPVWLMRQAGRYMQDFRQYSEKYSFRERSETPEIAAELSLQPWRKFSVDGVILFSDILTPLPAMGIDFTMISGKGPHIIKPIRSKLDIDALKPLVEVDIQVPFIRPALEFLSKEVRCKTTLIGFIGAPWTLGGYAVEGGHSKLAAYFKRMCLEDAALAHSLLNTLTSSLCVYASHQIACGAQVMQIFESWAHHLSEEQFEIFAKPYAMKIAAYLKEKHPSIPIVYFANGGSVYLNKQIDMGMTALSLDWRISMKHARHIVGESLTLAGNLDPMVLYGGQRNIQQAVQLCVKEAGLGGRHVLNLGHGVEKDVPEDAIQCLVESARSLSRVM